jgi:hypothetical protein
MAPTCFCITKRCEHGRGCMGYLRCITLFMDPCVSWSLWFVEGNAHTDATEVPCSLIAASFMDCFAMLLATKMQSVEWRQSDWWIGKDLKGSGGNWTGVLSFKLCGGLRKYTAYFDDTFVVPVESWSWYLPNTILHIYRWTDLFDLHYWH